jgi:hypothetical protein
MPTIRHQHPRNPCVGDLVCDRFRLGRLGIITAVTGDPVRDTWRNTLIVRWEDGKIGPTSVYDLWDPDSVIMAAQDKVARLAAQHAASRQKLHS